MSAILSIQFEHSMEPPATSSQALVPVTVTPYDPPGKPQDVLVPLRYGTVDVPIDAALYALRAVMPNGTLVTQTVDAREAKTGARIDAVLDISDELPNENSGWAYLLARPSRHQKAWRAPASKHESFGLESIEENAGWTEFDKEYMRRFWHERSDSGFVSDDDQRWDVHLSPYRDDSTALVLTRWIAQGERIWLEIGAKKDLTASKFVLLPPSTENAPTRVLLRHDPPTDVDDGDPWNVVVETGVESAAMLLAYLQNGNSRAAQAVGDHFLPQAIQLVQNKFRDYTSAVIACYYLHQVGAWAAEKLAGRPREFWAGWLENMDVRFPNHSDGAILHAWNLLRLEDLSGARDRFMHAAAIGLPLFNRGVRLLIDGLQFLASSNDGDSAVRKALNHVRTQSTSLDNSQPNLTAWGVVRHGVLAPLPRNVSSREYEERLATLPDQQAEAAVAY